MRDPAYGWTPHFGDSYGDLAASVGRQVGLEMDPEQRAILDAIYAEDRPGVPTCFEVGVIAPRQNLKTAALEVAALTDVFVLDERLHVWTAHLFKTAQRAFQDLQRMIQSCPDFDRRVSRIRTANGDEAIELRSGSRIEFHARSKGGGRGLTGDRITLDEALFLSAAEMGALLPVLATRPGAQIRYGSSAGVASSDVLRALRDRGRRGGDPRLAWFEWGAPRVACESGQCQHVPETPGCALDRVDLWEQANPALGGRIALETMHAFRRAMPPAEFAREFLSWWDEAGAADAFGAGKWEACGGTPMPGGVPMGGLAVAASYDLSRVAVAAAGVDEDGGMHGKPLRHGPGADWLPGVCRELQDRHRLDVVIDPRGPAADLIPALKDAGVRLREVSTGDVLDSCAALFKRVQDRSFHHGSYPELDAAASVAVPRPVGDRWAWGRKASASDISPLEAVTLAVWAAGQGSSSVYEDRGLMTV